MIEGIIPVFFNYTQIILFLKSHHFGKCSLLIFPCIIGDPRPPTTPILKSGGRDPTLPRIDAYGLGQACLLRFKPGMSNLFLMAGQWQYFPARGGQGRQRTNWRREPEGKSVPRNF